MNAPNAKRQAPGDLGVERLQGHGIIRRGDEQVAETDYDVMITPAELRGTGLSTGSRAKTRPRHLRAIARPVLSGTGIRGAHPHARPRRRP
jgi:hypothetical protein